MIEIRCLKDIQNISVNQGYPKELIKLLEEDLRTIREYADVDEEYTFEEYNTDYTDNGYIAILEGNESLEELENIGLTGGLSEVIPESAENYYMEGTIWTRIIVIYNDSYAMIFWLRDTNMFNSYLVVDKKTLDRNEPF